MLLMRIRWGFRRSCNGKVIYKYNKISILFLNHFELFKNKTNAINEGFLAIARNDNSLHGNINQTISLFD